MKEKYNNIVLLSVDALRKDRVNGSYDRDVAPFLSKLAKENTEYTNCFSTSSHTREAMSSMLTGVYPHKANRKGLMPKNAPGGGFHLDAETVSSYINLETGGFHSNPFLSRSFGYGKDWDKFDDDLYLGNSKILTLVNRFIEKLTNKHYSKASKINEISLEWIDSVGDNGFMVWNHYMDPHGPYQPPKEFKGEYQDEPISDRDSQKLLNKAIDDPESISQEEEQRLIDLYDEEVRHVDKEIEKFFNELEERGLLGETLVVIVGDHGESFGENGFYEHGGALTEELVRVPLIVVDGKNRKIDSPVSLIDIVPTILSESDESIEKELDGENLGEIADKPEDFKDRSVFFQETKNQNLKFGGFNGEEISVINLDDKDNLKEKGREGLEKKIEKYAEKALKEDVEDEEDDVEDEVKERLEALGYMGDKSR